jgi:hypothetical protein
MDLSVRLRSEFVSLRSYWTGVVTDFRPEKFGLGSVQPSPQNAHISLNRSYDLQIV